MIMRGQRFARLRVLLVQVIFPVILLLAGSAFAFDSDTVVGWLARYRPTAGQSTLEVNVARQVLAADATLRTPHDTPLVAIIGSSSVVNGVDAGAINAVWGQSGLPFRAVNLGQTGLVAYELALLKALTLNEKIKTVVFLYNSFSFADRLLGTVVGVRWHTAEMFRLQPPDPKDPSDWRRYATGMVNEAFAIVRYGSVLKSIVLRALRGDLRETPYFQDFPPEPSLDPPRERTPQQAATETDWLRAAYVDSQSHAASFGYRGFERFLVLAREKKVQVIVAPVPEPEFSRLNKWRVGTDPGRVDARVAEIAMRNGAIFWPRMRTQIFESDDSLFRDQTHFNRFGRERYSLALAEWLAQGLR